MPSLRNKQVEIQFGKSVCCKDFTSCKPKVGQKDEGCAVVITSLSALKQIFKDYSGENIHEVVIIEKDHFDVDDENSDNDDDLFLWSQVNP